MQEPYRSAFGEHRVVEAEDVAVAASEPGIPPVVCRWPGGAVPKAFVVFCHGLGGSGRGYAALSRAWAAQGYLVIHPTFPDAIGAVAASEPALGLDPAAPDLAEWAADPAIRSRMHEILHTPAYWLARIRIVRAVMETLDGIFAATCGRLARPIPGAIAGHSFGAYTSQLLAGAEIDLQGGTTGRFRDPRFRASVLLSPQGRDQQGLRDGSWDSMTGPALAVTGTLDRGAKGQDWRWKSEPYLLAPPGGKYLAVLDDADHHLGGIQQSAADAGKAAQCDAVAQITTCFLDAHVLNEPLAQAWLHSIRDRMGNCPVRFEHK